MKLIFALMLLLETAACVERFCSFYQSDPCYLVLGEKLNLDLTFKLLDSNEYNLRIQKIINSNPVCRIKKGSIRTGECDLYNNRSEVTFVNGILIINSVIRADSGNYKLEIFNSTGTLISSADLQVIVEDPLVLPLVLGCLAVILIVLIIVAFYFYKRNRLKLTPDVSERVNEPVAQKKREEQTSPDVEYATINSQSKRKNKRKRKEDEVQYGEVTFSSSSAQKPRLTQEDCVYADVQMR